MALRNPIIYRGAPLPPAPDHAEHFTEARA
jgi:hypothetical protein